MRNARSEIHRSIASTIVCGQATDERDKQRRHFEMRVGVHGPAAESAQDEALSYLAQHLSLTNMEANALRDLLAPFASPEELDEPLLAAITVHLDLLVRWNQHMNLTALKSPEEMVARHFGESLFAARQLFARNSQQDVFDVGSGAGFPGLPMKYWAPSLQLTLIEGHGKKATFLREVGRALQLSDFNVLNVRAEAVTKQASLVTMRAVEKFEHALAASANLVAPGGRLAILVGEAQCQRALSLLPSGESTTTTLPASEQRVLLCWTSK